MRGVLQNSAFLPSCIVMMFAPPRSDPPKMREVCPLLASASISDPLVGFLSRFACSCRFHNSRKSTLKMMKQAFSGLHRCRSDALEKGRFWESEKPCPSSVLPFCSYLLLASMVMIFLPQCSDRQKMREVCLILPSGSFSDPALGRSWGCSGAPFPG